MSAIVEKLAASHAERILETLRQAPNGMTDHDIERCLGIYLSSVNAARNALLKRGLVRDSGDRRPSGRGGMATVWVATDKTNTESSK